MSKRPPQVQIDRSLFEEMCAYFLDDDVNRSVERADHIKQKLIEKIDAIQRHEAYTKQLKY